METVKIEVPVALLQAANPNATDLSQEAVRLLALELFREEKISLSRAAELCRSMHGVSPIRYAISELEEDRKTLAQIGL